MEVQRELRWLALMLAFLPCVVQGQELTSDDQFAVAAGHYVGKNWQQAADQFQVYLQKHPKGAKQLEARFYRAECYVQLQKYDLAQAEYELVFKGLAKDNVLYRQTLFRRGETAYLKGDLAKARQPLSAFFAEFPKDGFNAFVLPYLGEIHLRNGDDDQAIQSFERALEEFPQGALVHKTRYGLAQALEMQGKRPEARRFYQVVSEQLTDPAADDAMMRIGFTWISDKDLEKAIQSFQTVLDSYQRGDQVGNAHYWLGRTYAKLRNWSAARKSLEAFLQLDTKLQSANLIPESRYRLGQVLIELKELGHARTQFHDVVHKHSKTKWAEKSLGSLGKLAWEARDQSALHHVVELLKRNFPVSSQLPLMLQLDGRLLLEARKYVEAEKAFQSLVQQAGADGRTLDSNYYYLGIAQLEQRHYDACLDSLTKVSPNADKDIRQSVRGAQASAWIGKGQFAQSIEPLETLLKDPEYEDSIEIHFQLVIAYAATGKLDQAWDLLEPLHETATQQAQYLSTVQFVAEKLFAVEHRHRAKKLFTIMSRDGNPAEMVQHGLSGLAWCDYQLDSSIDSMRSFKKLIDQYPKSPFAAEAAMVRAQWLAQQEELQAALTTYKLVLDHHDQSRFVAEALFEAANLQERLSLHPEALDGYKQLLQSYPAYERIDAALYNAAWILRRLKREEESLEYFQRLHDERPASDNWSDATYRLAEAAYEKKDYPTAERYLERLLNSNHDLQPMIKGHALYLQAQIALVRSQTEEAIEILDRLLKTKELARQDVAINARYWFAESLYRKRRFAAAAEQFDLLAKQSLTTDVPWKERIPLRQAQVLAHQGKWQEALEATQAIQKKQSAEESKDRSPTITQEVDYLMGRALASLGRLRDARDAYIRVVELPAGRRSELAAMAQWMIGETYFMQKNYKEALAAYHRVRVLFAFPTWQAAALLQSGKCHEVQRDWQKASQLYQEIIDKYPRTRFHADASRRLRLVQRKAGVAGGVRDKKNR